jgi:hypothetical protein
MKYLKHFIIICTLPLVLTACGGGGGSSPHPGPQSGHTNITNLGITDKPSNQRHKP